MDRNSRLCFKIQRNRGRFKRNGEQDDYAQSAEEILKCQFSDLLPVLSVYFFNPTQILNISSEVYISANAAIWGV